MVMFCWSKSDFVSHVTPRCFANWIKLERYAVRACITNIYIDIYVYIVHTSTRLCRIYTGATMRGLIDEILRPLFDRLIFIKRSEAEETTTTLKLVVCINILKIYGTNT